MNYRNPIIMKTTVSLLFATLIFAAMSCSSDDVPKNTAQLRPIDSIAVPDTVVLNKDYKFKIYYEKLTECDQFSHFQVNPDQQEEESNNTYFVGAIVTVYNQEECQNLEEPEIKEEEMKFRADQEDPYTFKFWEGVDQDDKPIYIEKTIVVSKEDGVEDPDEE